MLGSSYLLMQSLKCFVLKNILFKCLNTITKCLCDSRIRIFWNRGLANIPDIIYTWPDIIGRHLCSCNHITLYPGLFEHLYVLISFYLRNTLLFAKVVNLNFPHCALATMSSSIHFIHLWRIASPYYTWYNHLALCTRLLMIDYTPLHHHRSWRAEHNTSTSSAKITLVFCQP